MGRHATINWPLIDADIRNPNLRNCEIKKKHGISGTAVSLRRMQLGCRETKSTPHGEVPRMPVKEVLLQEALKKKAVRLGQPVSWVRDVWLRGEAGRQFISDGGYQ